MKIHYREVIEHDIEIDTEAVITTWKKIIARYTADDNWPNEKETDEILEDNFGDTLYYPYYGAKTDYFLINGNRWDIREVDDYYGTKVADKCENAVAEYLRSWGLLP